MSRVADAWHVLGRDQRIAALTALGLFVSMLLPWYSKTVVEGSHATQASLSAFQAFSFVEAAVLLVSAGLLAMLFARAEGRAFHVPGGDGTIVTIAGAWAAILIFYRMLDKPSLHGAQRFTASVGIEWGIFIALLLALGLLYVGRRIRASERGEPPLSRPRDGRHDARQRQERTRRPDPDGAETVVRADARRPRERAREAHPDGAETVVRRVDDLGLAPGADASERDQTAATAPVPARPGRARRAQSPRSATETDRPTADEPRPPRGRPRFPPAPSEQMSFEDSPIEED